jgi:hypothetical protein
VHVNEPIQAAYWLNLGFRAIEITDLQMTGKGVNLFGFHNYVNQTIVDSTLIINRLPDQNLYGEIVDEKPLSLGLALDTEEIKDSSLTVLAIPGEFEDETTELSKYFTIQPHPK